MQIGAYELHEVLGRGGTGLVYRGEHASSGQIVAVKVLAPECVLDPVMSRRFEQEFAAACRLDHPHIVRGLEFGIENGTPFLVMEFVDGKTLGKLVQEEGPLEWAIAIRLILQISDGLRLAHSHKLIHRDVKPDNILVGADGIARLTDLGLIKDLDAGTGLTRSRTCLGTAAYMAPEQFENARHADVRCDVYGLASSLYFALTGLPPFRARGSLGILKKKLCNELAPPSHFVPSLPPALDRIIGEALDVSLDKRPASCEKWMASLRGVMEAPAEAGPIPSESLPSLSPADLPRKSKNRRAAARYPSALGATCQSVQGRPDLWQAEIQDISLTGLRMALDRRFEVGTVLTLEILDEHGAGLSKWLARVQWVRDTMQKKVVDGLCL